MIEALLLAQIAPHAISWTAQATVYADDKTIPIESHTRMTLDGKLVEGESWPVAQGRAKGLHRMTLTPEGGVMHIGGREQPMPEAMVREERAQFGFYLQLQEAAAWCATLPPAASMTKLFEGEVYSSFRCTRRQLTRAANLIESDGKVARQDFRLDGLWRKGGAVFPRRMELLRDGKPYFTMVVTRFDAR